MPQHQHRRVCRARAHARTRAPHRQGVPVALRVGRLAPRHRLPPPRSAQRARLPARQRGRRRGPHVRRPALPGPRAAAPRPQIRHLPAPPRRQLRDGPVGGPQPRVPRAVCVAGGGVRERRRRRRGCDAGGRAGGVRGDGEERGAVPLRAAGGAGGEGCEEGGRGGGRGGERRGVSGGGYGVGDVAEEGEGEGEKEEEAEG
mmetsp:Transcript_21657/g.53431  ORF Transcript_21657/g.53431 Transcript_21657/m.53431 type:complete len:201 (-) Transcript_21657:684-1286(-)